MTDRTLRAVLTLLVATLLAGCASPDAPEEQRNAEFYNHNAQRLYDGGHYRQALDQFEKALRIEPSNPVALLGRSWSRLLLGEAQTLSNETEGPQNIQVALQEFQDLKGKRFRKDNYKVALGMGTAHALLGDLYRKRKEMLQAEADRRAESEARQVKIAEADRQMIAEYTQAETLFHQVLSNKEEAGAQDNLVALIRLAYISAYRNRFADALLYAERYLEQVRRSKELWVESIRKYPEDKAIWEIRLAGAVQKEVTCRDFLAQSLIELGRWEAAEDEFDHVILLDPDYGDAYLRRGIVRDKLGKKQEALQDFHSFLVRAAELDLRPEDPRVMEAVRVRDRIREELGLEPEKPLPEKGVRSK